MGCCAAASKRWAYREPEGFRALIDVLVEGTIDFLAAQIVAGAEVVQLFDRWAGIMPERRASAG
jgi:uroporphyrinogen decarboxylase